MENTNIDKVKFQKVLNKVKEIGKDQYEGKVSENILSIFNQLTTNEKRSFLKGLAVICFVLEDAVIEDAVKLDSEAKVSTNDRLREIKSSIELAEEHITDDIHDIDEFSQREFIKLKMWIIKAVTIGAVIGISLFFITMFIASDDKMGLFNSIRDFFKVMMEAIGL